ncbi:MAG: hypothetical protein M3547_03000, partial [Acidobacteriota bacterium]|nr:hypothetical protein [Acidobacteriota bacterium]
VGRIVLATVLIGLGLLFVTGATSRHKPSADCEREKVAFDLASEGLERAMADEDADLAAEFAREKNRAFDRYCACVGVTSTSSDGVGSRGTPVTPPPRGTPSYVPPRGRPVFTPPAGPPPGRPPATPPRTPHRGRPVFTPPGPPFTPPGPPPFTPPGRVRTPPPPTPTPV